MAGRSGFRQRMYDNLAMVWIVILFGGQVLDVAQWFTPPTIDRALTAIEPLIFTTSPLLFLAALGLAVRAGGASTSTGAPPRGRLLPGWVIPIPAVYCVLALAAPFVLSDPFVRSTVLPTDGRLALMYGLTTDARTLGAATASWIAYGLFIVGMLVAAYVVNQARNSPDLDPLEPDRSRRIVVTRAALALTPLAAATACFAVGAAAIAGRRYRVIDERGGSLPDWWSFTATDWFGTASEWFTGASFVLMIVALIAFIVAPALIRPVSNEPAAAEL